MCCTHTCNPDKTCIQSVPIFQNLSVEDQHTIMQMAETRKFNKGEYIFQEGQQSNKLFIVNKGIIKISKISHDGKEQIMRFLFPGDFLGQFALLQNQMHYANAEAINETEVCMIDKNSFLSTLEKNPTLSFQFIVSLNDLLHQADEWVSMISLMEIDQRLARVLLLFQDKLNIKNGKMTLPVSKKDLASLIGSTPETLSRKLLALASQNIIQLSGRRDVTILQPDRLQTIACL